MIVGMTMSSVVATHWSPRTRALLAVLCAALFLDSMDVSMVGVALPSIRADLGLSTPTLQWVVSGYVLGYGGFLLLRGRAADLLGRRTMFLRSLIIFTLATVMGGAVSTGFLVNASFQIGAAVGLAGVTAVVLARIGAHSQLSAYHAGLVASLGIALVGLLIVVVVEMLERAPGEPLVAAAETP
jgi:MFS family permease